MYDENMYAVRVLRAGGRGYVNKQEPGRTVIAALRRVLAGHIYVSENMATRLVDQFVLTAPGPVSPTGELSDRELEVLTLIGRGQATRDIAERLFLSVKTVEAPSGANQGKIKLGSGAELLRYAVQFTLDHQAKPRETLSDVDRRSGGSLPM